MKRKRRKSGDVESTSRDGKLALAVTVETVGLQREEV